MAETTVTLTGEPLPATAPAVTQQGTPPAQVAPVQATPAVDAEKQAMEAELAELRPLKGWQSEFTRAKQSGLYDVAQEIFAQEKNPAAVKARIQEWQKSAALVQQYGGPEKVKGFMDEWGILREQPPTAQPAPSAPAAQSPAQPQFTVNDLNALVDTKMAQRELASAKSDLIVELVAKAGKTGHPTAARQYEALVDAELAAMTTDPYGNKRQVTPEDIGQAVAVVERDFVAPLVTPPKTPVTPTTVPIPPTMNGRGPGGQQPGKPVSQMTREEALAWSEARAAEQMGTVPIGTAQGGHGPMKSNWSFDG